MMSRNHLLDLFKLVLIIVIAFHHTAWTSMTHGYIPVEFFFIVSGYFIYRAWLKSKSTVIDFMKHKCRRVLPLYEASLIIYVIFAIIFPQFYPDADYNNLGSSLIRDVFLLQAVGVNGLTDISFIRFNPPDWYLSVFFWGGAIVYLLLFTGKYAKYILCAIILATYYILYEIGFNDVWGYHTIMYVPLWRGMAGMSLGVLIGKASQNRRFRMFYDRHIKFNNSLALLCVPIIVSLFFSHFNSDILATFLFVILITNLINPEGLSKYCTKGLMKYVPDISLEILLLHKLLIILTVKVADSLGIIHITSLKYLLFIIILVSVGYITKYLLSHIEARGNALLNRIPVFAR